MTTPIDLTATYNRPLILCDIDGTLAAYRHGLIQGINSKFKLNMDVEDMPYHGQGLVNKKWLKKWHKNEINALNLAPCSGACEGLSKLFDAGFSVTIASLRNPTLKEVTRLWLTRNNVRYDQLVMNGSQSKLDVILSTEGNIVWFDDLPENWQYASQRIHIYCPKQPYTPTDIPDNVTVFDRWDQIIDQLL